MPLVSTSQYAAPEDLVKYSLTSAQAQRFGAEQQAAACMAASAIADSFLSSQFALPLATYDVSLVMQVCNIAAWILHLQYGMNPNAPIDQIIQLRYENAIAWLTAISKSTISPNWTDASGTDDAAGDFVISDKPIGVTSRGVTDSGEVW